MSQILNWAENFLSANANAARDLVVNPIVDLWSFVAKWYARWAAGLLWKDPDKAAASVDKVADILKTWWGYNAKQEVDPTSIAWAIGDWLIRWVDQAAAVLTLAEAAKQLPKVAQAGWNKILNKVSKAKTPAQQQSVAKEARDYITKHVEINDDLSKRMYNQSAEVPAYQQRAYAAENPWMSKYKTEAASTKFAVTKDWDTTIWRPMTYYENSLKQRLTPERASQLWVPYRKWTYWDRLKASNQRFLDEAPTPRSKSIRANESKWANDLWMTAEQLRAEANKYWGSTQWYYEQRKALDKLGVNNFNDYAKTFGLNWWTPNIHEVQEYNRIKNTWKAFTAQKAAANKAAKDIWFKDMSEATNTFIETKAPFNSVKEMLDYISTAKKPTKWIYPKSFVDRPDIMKFSGWDWSLANIADAQEKYNWYMNSYPSYLERIRNKNNRSL